MSTTRLPELPPAKDEPMLRDHPYYGAAEVHAYGLAVWKAAMERAATELREAAEAHREAAAEETDQQCSEWHRATDAAYSCAAGILSSLPLPEQGGPQ